MAEFELNAFYDQMINWPKRLQREGAFYRKLFAERGVRTVLDCACGTGRHAKLFADWGLSVTASDVDAAMLAQTREHCPESVRVVQSSFAELPEHFGAEFDAVVCVGNSLAAVESDADLAPSLEGMRRVVRPGGVVVLHTLNLAGHANDELNLSPPKELEHDGRPLVAVRWRYRHDDHLMTAAVFLEKTPDGWQASTRNRALRTFTAETLTALCREAGLAVEHVYGKYDFTPLAPAEHTDLIVVAGPAPAPSVKDA